MEKENEYKCQCYPWNYIKMYPRYLEGKRDIMWEIERERKRDKNDKKKDLWEEMSSERVTKRGEKQLMSISLKSQVTF